MHIATHLSRIFIAFLFSLLLRTVIIGCKVDASEKSYTIRLLEYYVAKTTINTTCRTLNVQQCEEKYQTNKKLKKNNNKNVLDFYCRKIGWSNCFGVTNFYYT